MFERVISQSIQTITTQTLRERSLISLVEILEDERIPTRLKPFFETEVRWWLFNEMLARQANKRFDYDHPELASLLTYLEQVQFRHARFEREDFLNVLDSAVKLTYNYLCRPQTTLKWYIFRGQPVMPLREVMLRFGAFLDYPYFRTVFTDWVESKQRERPTFDGISASEFERVIRRIDDQILLNCTVEDLLGIINPIFEFVGEGEEMVVPVDALIIYFDDKNIKRLVDFLEQVRANGRDVVGREDFVLLLDELLSTAEDEPEADFSDVYQNDELDDVVRRHIESGTAPVTPVNELTVQEDDLRLTEENWRGEPSTDSAAAGFEEYAGDQVSIDVATDADEMPATGWIDPEDHRRFAEAFGTVFAEKTEGDEPEIGAENVATSKKDVSEVDDPSVNDVVAESDNPEIDSASLPDESSGRVSAMIDDEDIADEGVEVEEEQVPGEEIEDEVTDPLEPDDGGSEEIDGNHDVDAPDSASGEPTPHDDVPTEEEDEDPTGGDNALRVDDSDEDSDEETDSAEFNSGNAGVVTSTLVPAPVRAVSPETIEAEPQHPLEDVRSFITPMLERKILKRVFNRDRDQYESALNQLNSTTTWRAASQVLDEVFIRFDVDPYSRTAIRFTDSIYGRYLPRT